MGAKAANENSRTGRRRGRKKVTVDCSALLGRRRKNNGRPAISEDSNARIFIIFRQFFILETVNNLKQ